MRGAWWVVMASVAFVGRANAQSAEPFEPAGEVRPPIYNPRDHETVEPLPPRVVIPPPQRQQRVLTKKERKALARAAERARIAQQNAERSAPIAAALEAERLEREKWVRSYVPSEPVPSGWHVESHYSQSEIVGGSLLFALTYGLSLAGGIAAINKDNEVFTPLVIPGAGPIVSIVRAVDRYRHSDGASDFGPPPGFVLVLLIEVLVIDVIGQLAGGALLVHGLAAPQKKIHRDDPLGTFRF